MVEGARNEDSEELDEREARFERTHREGRELAEKGIYVAALEKYLWCWDLEDPYSHAYCAVRSSFLLADIVELGRSYPAALEALEARRDVLESIVLLGKGGWETQNDYCHLNESLACEERTIALYERLRMEDPANPGLRDFFENHVVDLLRKRGRHWEILRGVVDVQGSLDDSLRCIDERVFFELRKVVPYFEALLAAGPRDAARRTGYRLLCAMPRVETLAALVTIAKRVGASDFELEVLELANETLTAQERAKFGAPLLEGAEWRSLFPE